MVGGIFIPQWSSKEDAELLFIDPEPDPRLIQLETLTPETVASAVRRQSLAKGLAMSGLWGTATAIDGGELTPQEITRIRQIEKGEIGFNSFVEHDLGWRRSIEYRAIDNSPDEGGAFITQLTIDVPRTFTDFIKQTVNSQGQVASADVDVWLAHQAQVRRQENGSDKTFQTVETNDIEEPPPSAWRFDQHVDNDVRTAVSVTLPSGLRFTLSLTQAD